MNPRRNAVRDALRAVIRTKRPLEGNSMFPPLPDHLLTQIESYASLEGWAPQEKMRDMLSLVLREKPAVAVEIGVFAGRSALPVLLGLKENNFGVLHAVDPYSAEVCREGTHDDVHKGWWENELTPFRDQFLGSVKWAGLDPWLQFHQVTGDVAAVMFDDESVDLVHVDANHSPEVSLRDVRTWWAKLKPKSFCWIDDTDWPSLSGAVNWLRERGTLVKDYEKYQLWQKP